MPQTQTVKDGECIQQDRAHVIERDASVSARETHRHGRINDLVAEAVRICEHFDIKRKPLDQNARKDVLQYLSTKDF